MEAREGIEPSHRGFADRSVTTSPPGHIRSNYIRLQELLNDLRIIHHMVKKQLKTTNLTNKDWEKVRKDLLFIEEVNKLSKGLGVRVIISGGYAVDGALGQITRPHNDLDGLMFGTKVDGQEVVENLLQKITRSIPELSNISLLRDRRSEYYHSIYLEGDGIGVDIYYIQISDDPFLSTKQVVKKDGSLSDVQDYEVRQGLVREIEFEVQSPEVELVDRLYKREITGEERKPEHDQDIENLRMITDSEIVYKKLADLSVKD